jgi:hypothetical protein
MGAIGGWHSGFFNHTEVTMPAVDGSSTTVAKDVNSSGMLLDQSNTTASADGCAK